ncbi:MAG: VWA domain-containing protein [Alphaproteobacteria bacterium]|nr:VWA domain-containing protein [Alphaproteobacteria bacterium]
MVRPLEDFIRALRAAEVRVSVAEAMEAHEVTAHLGFADRTLLKDGLSLTLAKTFNEKQRFDDSFELFFTRDQFHNITAKPGDANDAPEPQDNTGNDLADMLLNDDREGLAAAMEDAGRAAGVGNIRFRTQVNFMARRIVDQMGLAELERLIAQVARGDIPGGDALATELEVQRSRLIEEGRAFVERQYELYGRFTGQQLREEFLERTPLAAVDRRDYQRMNTLIRRMARKLASKYRARHKRTRRGHLDVRRTLRVNMAHDAIPFETVWKQKRIERPKVVVIVDVSRSVAAAAQFLLMFLYNLNEALSDLRSFAFSSSLVAVDDILNTNGLEEAIPKVLDKIGFMSTDYGRALDDLKSEFADTIDRRTTVIILGDARSNYGDPRADVMRWINQRARRVVWLNPEPETFWGTGDSEMRRYRPYCHVAKTCRTIKDLERVVDDILRSQTRA